MYKVYKPTTDKDAEQIYELLRTVFRGEDVDKLVKRLLEYYPETGLNNLFTVRDGGKIVATLILIPQTWIMDGFELKVAEMGCVATHPDHRRKGLQALLNREFDKTATNEGYDLCALAGIPFFYRQFGYEYSVELDHTSTIPVHLIKGKGRVVRYRVFKGSDIPEASKLFESSQKDYFVKQKRTQAVWNIQQSTHYYKGEPFESYILRDEGGILGYLRLREDKNQKVLYLNEACLRNNADPERVLGLLKSYCQSNKLETIVSRLSYEDELSRRLRSLGAEQKKPYAWQVKIVDYLKLFQRLAPLLEKRLKSSKFSKLDETLNLNFRKFTIQICIREGRIVEVEKTDDCSDRTIGLNPYVFPKLLLGYRRIGELEYSHPDFSIKHTHKKLMEILFPGGPGYIHHVY